MHSKILTCVWMTWMGGVAGWAQQSDLASVLGYPDMVLHSGKIVTMDDPSFDSEVGTIVEAMAVREGKILATGTNGEIRRLSGPQTLDIDLKGRMVLPSFVITHEHPTDWAFQEPRAMTHVLPNDDVVIHRWMPNLPPKEQLERFEPMMRQLLEKAKPGQWIFMSFNYGPDYEHATEMAQLFAQNISKEYLDRLAPENPVKIRNGFITSRVNQKAIDELLSVHPDFDDAEFLKNGGGFSRTMEPDAMFKGNVPLLAKILKAELELWASYGATMFASSPYAFSNLAALRYLDSKGEMPVRFGWGYPGPAWDLETLRIMASVMGTGSERLWMAGTFFGSGGNCMTVPMREGWKANPIQIPGRRIGRCNLEPGSPIRERLETLVKAGMRVATIHTGGDKDIDNLLEGIEKASLEAGMTLEEVRAKRHAFDHTSGAPRRDQIDRMKQLGMMASLNNTLLWEPPGVVPNMTGTSLITKIYGLEYGNWIAPRQSMTDAGVMSSFEIDRPLPHKLFFFVTKGMNRYHDHDGRVYGARERTDRIIQLKALTRWGAHYLLREDVLGTLEPGKYADFVVLDRDFLTVPEEEIPSLRVLMTVVGGEMVHLVSALAGEIGRAPVGATTWQESFPEGW